MGTNTGIEWTIDSWNPIVGCSIISLGCTNCYAMRQAARLLDGNPRTPHYAGTTKIVNDRAVWTGNVALAPEANLSLPMRQKRPRLIFVNSMGDLFHTSVDEEWVDRVFAYMALGNQHFYQVLTKRDEIMLRYMSDINTAGRVAHLMRQIDPAAASGVVASPDWWPLKNVALGVSIEAQPHARRAYNLAETPAVLRFVSAEPLISGLDLKKINVGEGLFFDAMTGSHTAVFDPIHKGKAFTLPPIRAPLDWLIVGGESGPGARPMHPDWVRCLKTQALTAGVPFFFKQWGDWYPLIDRDRDDPDWRKDYTRANHRHESFQILNLAGGCGFHGERVHLMERRGKNRSGAELDERLWREMPEAMDKFRRTA